MVRNRDPDELVVVIGLGTMGRKLTRLCLASNLRVLAMSRSPQSEKKHLDQIRQDLMVKVSKGQVTAELVGLMLGRIELVRSLEDLGQAEFVIEAISEDATAKRDLYRQIEPYLADNAILATNTSSLSVTELSKGVENRSRFVGMHFFNPPEVMKLVEVKGSKETAHDTLEKVIAMAKRLGRSPLVVPDEPGYYVNRVLFPMIVEGIRVLESFGGNPKDIDDAMKLGANLPMGPLELSDYIGNDIVLNICEILVERTNDSRFEPPKLLTRMVLEGKLGRKSRQGFYKY